jgi:Pyruvate/2-oxoacid:ferredoxin oxidoreductase delta subunit
LVYDQLIIYYFSGTGNARNAALWINQVAEEHGLKTQLVNIDNFDKIELPELSNKTLIGFCSPTHGFNLPPLALKFIWKFPRLKNTDAFILNTRGGLKLSKVFIPGASGAAQLLPALILKLKGFRIVGMQPLDLPSNWLILHPGLRQHVVQSIYSRCNTIVNDFASDLLKGKKRFKALLSLPIDLILLPIAVGYYFIGRFFLAKTLVATDACNNCEKCVDQCPVSAIKMIDDLPYWTYRCESCMRCVNACPQRAIETAHAFSISLLFISSLVISPLLIAGIKYLGVFDFLNQSFFSRNVWSILDWIIFLLFVFLSYRVLHYLMRYKFFNRIIAYTSLSKYKFWRRYKPPRNTAS